MAHKSREPTKILYVAFEEIPATNGKACWITEEIKELARHFHLDVLSLKSEDLSHIERYHGARLLRVPVGGGPWLERVKTFQRALSRQLDSEDYRLCHFTSVWEGMVLSSRKNTGNLKLIYEVHSLPSVDFRTTNPDDAQAVEQSYSLKQQEERCLSQADCVVVGSELLGKHLMSRGVPQARIQLVRPAIDLAPFDAIEETPRHTATILYLGNLMPWQGIHSLLMALAELPFGLPVKLLLVAPRTEPWLREVLGKIQMLGLARKVELINPVPLDKLPVLVSRANVCVAPLGNHEHNSLAASTPHKLLVYMACRRAVVASNQLVVKEILQDGIHGLLYPPGDTRGLAEALQKLLLNLEQATRLGNQARLHLEEEHHLDSALDRLLVCYRNLIGEPRGEDEKEPTQPGFSARQEKKAGPTYSDTRPGLPAPLPEEDEFTEDTAPFSVAKLKSAAAAEAAAEKAAAEQAAAEQAEAAPAAQIDTEPSGRPIDKEVEIFFKSVDDEDTAPRRVSRSSESWQVMEVAQIDLPARAPAPGEEKKEGQFLLGGPPIPVDSAHGEADFDKSGFLKTAQRDEKASTPTGIPVVADVDVEIIEPEPAYETDDTAPMEEETTKPITKKNK